MHCLSCGKPLTPNSKFCADCGHPVVVAQEAPIMSVQQPREEQPDLIPPSPGYGYSEPEEPQSNNNVLLIAIAVLVAVIVIGLAAMLMLKSDDTSTDRPQTATPTQQPVQATPDPTTTPVPPKQETPATPESKPPKTKIPDTSKASPVAPLKQGPTVALSAFQTPSGNIHCIITDDYVRCDIKNTDVVPTAPESCQLDYGYAYQLASDGTGEILCAGDTVNVPGNPKLSYGTTTKVKGFSCLSASQLLVCTSPGGKEMKLSRSVQKLPS